MTDQARGLGPDPMDRNRFPADPWRLINRCDVSGPEADSAVSATLFSLANGYIGVRADGDGMRGLGHGTFLNGFHETFRIHHAEQAYGFARVGQVIQGVPDAVGFRLQVDGESLSSDLGRYPKLESCEQEVDFRTGVWTRNQHWVTTSGGRVQVVERRMVALCDQHLVVATLSVTPDFACQVDIVAGLDDKVTFQTQADDFSDPRLAEQASGGGLALVSRHTDGARSYASYRCRNSRMTMAVGTHTELVGDLKPSIDSAGRLQLTVAAQPGEPVEVVRYAAYHSDRVNPTGVESGLAVKAGESAEALEDLCALTLDRAQTCGLDSLFASQASYLADFWAHSDVVVEFEQAVGAEVSHDVESPPASALTSDGFQQAVRWSLFQLAQVSAQTHGVGIAAKGLSGSGYSGHYFWDTEVFVLPFLTYTNPAATRRALAYRFDMLSAARRRAAQMSEKGALFPWRTINGEEASAYYPAGTAQYHIDADIAYALCQYVAVSGDQSFMACQGVDILVETARLWASLGFFGEDGRFHIHGVTGPDEYSAVVDDNFYTNAMASFNLAQAASVVEALAQAGTDLAHLHLGESETELWREAAKTMYLPWDSVYQVHPQDSHFLSQQPWDFAASAGDDRPLLLRYHPLVIYRHQVLKQADTVLALHLLSNRFTPKEKRADFDFYEPLTTGDSTLSACTQAVIAAEVGHTDLALDHFAEALFIDLANRHSNTDSGVHIASAGGVWTTLVAGFGGLRDGGMHPRLDPRLPSDWRSLSFCLALGQSRVAIRVTHAGVELTLTAGPGIELPVCGQVICLTPEAPQQAIEC